jgi:hypothetical protein
VIRLETFVTGPEEEVGFQDDSGNRELAEPKERSNEGNIGGTGAVARDGEDTLEFLIS